MVLNRPRLLLVSDPTYPAAGRRYGDEDILLADRLRAHFTVATCHPVDTVALMDAVDVVLVRNSGPIMRYRVAHQTFVEEARRRGTLVYNPLTGSGDMAGKQYLVDLCAEGLPTIPTVDRLADLDRLPVTDCYVVKPKDGADSIGLRMVPAADLRSVLAEEADLLIQPRIDMVHEISFVVVDRTVVYAVYAPDPARRWDLQRYQPSADDVAFAQRFVQRNTLQHGVQRVDACRTPDGDLLLVELEDLNPYLSLETLDDETLERFVDALVGSICRSMDAEQSC